MSGTGWLGHVTVADAGSTPAARYCGWLFAQNGATVIDVSEARTALPGAATDFLDTGKRPVDGLPAEVDVVITDHTTTHVPAARLVGVVDRFGQEGPRADWVADEMVLAALGGAAGYTRARGGEPVYGFGYRYQYLAGLYLYIALTAGLSDPRSPARREFRVSELETVASVLPYATTQYEYNGSESLLEQSGPRFVVPCRDGWVVVYAGLAWNAIVGLLGRPDLAEDDRFMALDARFGHVQDLAELFDAWGSTRSVEEALADGALHDVAATAVRSPAEVLADPELAERGLWQDVRRGGLAPTLPYLVVTEGDDDAA